MPREEASDLSVGSVVPGEESDGSLAKDGKDTDSCLSRIFLPAPLAFSAKDVKVLNRSPP